jgi:outer membrane receptor for ferrienterochelin and colicins
MPGKSLLIVALLLSIGSAASAQEPVKPPATDPPPAEDALFQDMPVVEAASLHMQTLAQAPANVTIITDADIRKYGYRTLAEALAGVRGFTVTYDRIYHYLGVQGFSLPGDYNTRIIVMLNGHSLTEIVYDSANFLGQDFGLDMDLVQRIEIVRGPSSALYGSNGIFATINVITKSPVDQPKARVSTENDSLGERKAMASTSLYLGSGANLLVSASVFNNASQTLYFPEFDTPQTNNGISSHDDGERGYHTFANLVWHNWSLTAYFNSREKQTPVAYDNSAIFDDSGSHVQDQRDFIRLSHSSDIGSGQLRFDVSYDYYAYHDRYFYPLSVGVQDFRNLGRGQWIGSQLTYSLPVPKLGRLTVGVQGTLELQNLQLNYAVSPVPYVQLRISRPDRKAAVFAQQEWEISQRWKAYLGLRYDISQNFQSALSPKVALVYQQNPETVFKFVYGHPFRNPSAYEQYFADNLSIIAAGPLRAETAHTFEVAVERKLGHDLSGVVNVYDYYIHNLIQAVFIDDTDALQQYRNIGSATSTGIEFELSGKPCGQLEVTGSLALQRTVNGLTGSVLPNSPEVVPKLRFAVPVIKRKITLSSSQQYMSARETRDGSTSVRPVLLLDFTATTDRVFKRFDISFGVRNLLNWIYSDPTAIAVDSIQQDGRSVFLKLIYRPVE